MGLKLALAFAALTLSGVAMAEQKVDAKYFTISQVRVEEVKTSAMGFEYTEDDDKNFGWGNIAGIPDPIGDAGRVIAIARDLVALGEEVYRLVDHGRPHNVTEYAPISVVPRINGKPADVFETEGWRAPTKKTYKVSYDNLYGVTVVDFKYSVVYSYGGHFNGAGAYLTAVQIIPEYVKTLFGFDFTATMKLGGIQNQGTRNNPIAGATIIMEYTISNILQAVNRADAYFITGQGGFKRL
ncbi:hypothetical protein ACJVC5_17065 [Peredibacter sp. HCB2-198]|uniref:hypothetical protein n=1 Tax=Peredibacter sp. HCB2-198 TaxID=3383025 RepID=UPI0038B43606